MANIRVTQSQCANYWHSASEYYIHVAELFQRSVAGYAIAPQNRMARPLGHRLLLARQVDRFM
jgi:hypothetical protein